MCDNTLTRHHVIPRRALFDPTISKDILIDLAKLQPERVTNVMFVTESSENLCDVWIAGDREPKLLPDYWIGSTVYVLSRDCTTPNTTFYTME